MNWNGKPYHTLDFELKSRFGQKVYKIAWTAADDLPKPGRNPGNARLYLLQ